MIISYSCFLRWMFSVLISRCFQESYSSIFYILFIRLAKPNHLKFITVYFRISTLCVFELQTNEAFLVPFLIDRVKRFLDLFLIDNSWVRHFCVIYSTCWNIHLPAVIWPRWGQSPFWRVNSCQPVLIHVDYESQHGALAWEVLGLPSSVLMKYSGSSWLFSINQLL